jgi:hypothetical protein
MMEMERNLVTRSQLAAMTPISARSVALNPLNQIIDDPPPPPVRVQAGEISRREWDALSQVDRLATIQSGTRVVDADPLPEAT